MIYDIYHFDDAEIIQIKRTISDRMKSIVENHRSNIV
jgi:hypothetical protein